MINYGLTNKRALITGGSHGIGLSIAEFLSSEGCHVAICSRSTERLNKAKELLSKNNVDIICLEADVLIDKEIDACISELDSCWGYGVDILINNVGGGGRWGQENIENTEMSVWDDVYQKNTRAAIKFTKWAVSGMSKKEWGRVISIASIYGKEGGGRPWFNMAKSAQISLMKSLSLTRYLVRKGITFNTVAPGAIMIPETGWEDECQNDPEKFKYEIEKEYTLGRLGSVEEVASLVIFLCSKQASLINGACIPVDGGQSRAF